MHGGCQGQLLRDILDGCAQGKKRVRILPVEDQHLLCLKPIG